MPYWFNLHVDDVGHTLVLGATRSGKELPAQRSGDHLNTTVHGRPSTSGYHRKLAGLLDGGYLELGLGQRDVTINPFDVEHPSADELHFLRLHARASGEDGYRLTDAEDRETYGLSRTCSCWNRGQRRLFTLANPAPAPLERASTSGSRVDGTAMFDNPNALRIDRLQVFDFESMREFRLSSSPTVLTSSNRVNRHLHDARQRWRFEGVRHGRGMAG